MKNSYSAERAYLAGERTIGSASINVQITLESLANLAVIGRTTARNHYRVIWGEPGVLLYETLGIEPDVGAKAKGNLSGYSLVRVGKMVEAVEQNREATRALIEILGAKAIKENWPQMWSSRYAYRKRRDRT